MHDPVNIKNMVCPRCIDTISSIFDNLKIPVDTIELGKVFIQKTPTQTEIQLLETQLQSMGFELIKDKKSEVITQIKSIIIDQVHYQSKPLTIKYSTLIAEKLNSPYQALSRLFSLAEGITIEKFILRQKIEKIKELISYKELTLSEIAHQLNYSSVAHLSNQFKKETGFSPTKYKSLMNYDRQTLDSI